MNLIKNKKFTGAVAGVLAGVMLMSGALALQGSNSIINRFFGASDDPFVPPTIEENWDPGAMGTKEITVKNTGDAIVYARVNLSEYLDITAPIPTNATEAGTHAFTLNFPTNANAEAGRAATFGVDFEWTFDNMMTVAEYSLEALDGPVPPTWVYGTDGWAYWTAPIMPNTETDIFLAAVNYAAGGTLSDTDDYYYAIKAGFEWVTQSDLGLWTGATTTPADPDEPNQTPVQAAAPANIRTILNPFYLTPPALPGAEFAPDFTIGGTEYAQIPSFNGGRILEDEAGNSFYYKGENMTDLDDGTANPADVLPLLVYTGAPFTITPGGMYDEPYTVTAKYFIQHSVTTAYPVYDTGVNIWHSIHNGGDGTFFTNDDGQGLPNQPYKVPNSQVHNFD